MRTLVKLILGLGTVIGALVLWLAHDELHMMSADARSGDAAVWVYTPHVAPGDTITLGVTVSAGEDIGIQEVVVDDGASEHRVHGGGADWGDTITTSRTASSAEDSLDVPVHVPRNARPGSTLRLTVAVSYVVASQWGAGSFSNSSRTAKIILDVPVRTPAGATFRRALSAAWGLGLLAALCAGLFFAMPAIDRWSERNKDVFGDGEMAGLFMLLLVVFNAMIVGRAVFALPLVRATGFTSTGFFVVACALWTILPIVACVYGYKRGRRRAALSPLGIRAVEGRPVVDPGDPYRAEPDAATAVVALTRRTEETPGTLAALAELLRGAGLAVTVKGRRLLIDGGDGKGPSTILHARDPARVTISTLVFHNRDMREAFVVLHAALPVLGPVELRLPFGAFLIDRRSSRDQLRAELDERFHAWLDGLSRGLRPLDVASLLGDKPGTLR